MGEKYILDACCGSKMFWYDKENVNTIYIDNRKIKTHLCDGRKFEVNADLICDFKKMPFERESFNLVVFDPPHLIKAGEKSFLAAKYGVLPSEWENEIVEGFKECMRVLKQRGVLIFKWSDVQTPLSAVLNAIPYKPLFGDKRAKTSWTVFIK